jgi:chemotaxis protein CheD
MLNMVSVGLGEVKISRDPMDVLTAFGLGSCLGIGMYDPVARVAGLLHAILPSMPNGSTEHAARYVDSGIRTLLNLILNAGGLQSRLIIRMAGGANMLVAPGFSSTLNIGSRNIEVAYATFNKLNLKLASQDVGGSIGRTVRFYVADGRMTIRTIGNQEREV